MGQILERIPSQGYDAAGFVRVRYEMSNGNQMIWKFRYADPTQQQLDELEARWVYIQQMDSVPYIAEGFVELEERPLIIDFLVRVKANPSLTLTQYNNYLSTIPWSDASKIRYFVFRLSEALARHYNIDLEDRTEQKVLGKVRDWIVARSKRELAKILFNHWEEVF